MKRDGEAGWRRNVERMVVQKGAQIFPADMDTLIKYLSTALGPSAGRMQPTGALPPGALASGAKTVEEVRLPAGPGKELVEGRCAACHDLGRVVSIPRKRNEWDSLVRNMVSRAPQTSPATPAQLQAMVDYLATNFLEKAQ
jgi:mono/diheme cytochrome c family protein